jgi:hypothetical protein
MANLTRETFLKVRSMEKGYIDGKTEIFTLANFSETREKE